MYVKLICLAPQLTTLRSSRSKAGLKPWVIRFWYFITITTKRNCHTFHVPQSIDTNFPLSGTSSTQLSIYRMNKITTTCEKDQWMHDKVQELIPRLKTNLSIFAFLFFFNPIELNWIEFNWTVDDTGEKCVCFVCYVRQFQLLKFNGGRESWCSSVTCGQTVCSQ